MTSLSNYEGKKLEDFILERHDLAERTRAQYRLGFQVLSKYTDHLFTLDRREMNEALQQLARNYAGSSWNAESCAPRAHARKIQK